MVTPIAGIPEINEGQLDKYWTHNEAIRQIEALSIGSIKSRLLTSPPSSPVEGDLYIVAATASGAWTGKEKYITQYTGASWKFYPPFNGQRIWSIPESTFVIYNGTSWSAIAGSSGDMARAVYDTDNDGVVDAAESLSGTPGNSKYYGTDGAGSKGFYNLPTGNVGDMVKSTYDVDNDGIVDNAENLSGQAPSYYLTRSNHTGTQPSSTISDFVTSVRASVLTGLSTATSSVVAATDTVLDAIGKLQAQITLKGLPSGGTTGQVLKKNSGTDYDISWGTGGSSGSSDFLGLSDTPDSYTGQGLKSIRVNSGATGLEFANPIGRETLTSDRNYYADLINGNNSNDGLSPSSPKTVQGMADVIGLLDIGVSNVILNIANQTSNSAGGITAPINLKAPISSGGKFIVRGDVNNPENVRLNLEANTFLLKIENQQNCAIRLEGLTLQCKSGSGYNDTRLLTVINSKIEINKLRFGANNSSINNQSQIYLDQKSICVVAGNYEIFGGNFYAHLWCRDSLFTWEIGNNYTVTLTNTPAYTDFIYVDISGRYNIYYTAMTWSGSATGRRYEVDTLGLIRHYSPSSTYLPGNASGVTTNGGVYV